jgi:hypothetical protein
VAHDLLIRFQEELMAEINWLRRFDEATAQATQTAKPMLIDFTAAPM